MSSKEIKLANPRLSVPYVTQTHLNSCGSAALDMVYKYYGLKGNFQEDIFKKYRKQNPSSPEDFYVLTDDLINDAIERGFEGSCWRRMNLERRDLIISKLRKLIKKGVPIIACQQYTKELSYIGHFRVVVCITDKYVYFHDPSPEYGGENIKWSLEKFIDFWRRTGDNVTRGVFLIIQK